MKQERQRAAAEAAAQAARERRAQRIKVVAVVVGLVVVIAGLVFWRYQSTQQVATVADPGPQVPSERLDDGVAIGAADGPVVDIYLDFLCPHCAEMEERIGGAIEDMAVDGDARFVIHPITLLDPTESARSAAAFGCAAGTDSVLGFQKALFDNASGGFSTERLLEIGASVGLDDPTFVQCVEDESDADWAAAVDSAATERGVTGTPTIFVDDEKMKLEATETAGAFRAEIALMTR